MSDSPDTKVCGLCAETIKTSAKVCPYCQSRQGRFPVWKQDLLQWSCGLLPLIAFGGLGLWLLVKFSPSNARKFEAHRGELSVVRHSLEFARQTPDSWRAGLGTNQWERKWSFGRMEVHFLDAQGNTLNVQNPVPDGFRFVEPCLWLTGFVTNSGSQPWSVSEFEVRFFDAKSNLLDV